MAKKSTPRIGQQTKTSAKGAHGGDVKYVQPSLGSGFKNIAGKGINAGKSAAKLPQPKASIAESNVANAPRVMLGKGFAEAAANTPAAKTKGGEKMFFDSKAKKVPAVKACSTPSRKGKSMSPVARNK